MAYSNNGNKSYNNNRTYNNNGGYRRNDNQQPRRPKKETFTFKLISTFTVPDRQNGTVEVDNAIVMDKLAYLQDGGVFELLTQNISISNALLYGDSARKGNATVGYISNVDIAPDDACTMEVTIFGTSVENIKKLMETTDLVVSPRIIAYNGEFRCFNGFNLVAAE